MAAEAHPPTHVLAELIEGVLDEQRAREVRAHLELCLTCQSTVDKLTQVTVALAAVPAQISMPEFVSARISAALAAESAGAAEVRSDADGGTVAWFRRRLPQALAAAASIAVIGLAGYVGVTGGSGGGNDNSGDVVAAEGAGSADDDTATSDPRHFTGRSDQRTGVVEGDDPAADEGLDEDEITAAVVDMQAQSSELTANCGRVLSDELGQDIVGSRSLGSGVLIVLQGDETLDGWLLPTCNSLSSEALTNHVEVLVGQ